MLDRFANGPMARQGRISASLLLIVGQLISNFPAKADNRIDKYQTMNFGFGKHATADAMLTVTEQKPSSAFGLTVRRKGASGLHRDNDTKVLVACLPVAEEALKQDIVNVTKGCGSFSVISSAPIEIEVPFDDRLLPRGLSVSNVRLFREVTKVAANDVIEPVDSHLDLDNKRTVTTLNEFSGRFLNAVLTAPDAAEQAPQTHTATALSSLTKVNPLASQIQLAAPQPEPGGSASLVFPKTIRPVRGGNQPRFDLTYNSLRGEGLAGEGWNLDVPAISVETKWGVPEFSTDMETETYIYQDRELVSFDGGKEVPPAYRNNFNANPIKRRELRYRLRRDDEFLDVRRHGGSPADYWWEVIYKNGNREFYGADPGTGAVIESAIRRTTNSSQSPIAQWNITLAVDPDGNIVKYQWEGSRACVLDATTGAAPSADTVCQTALLLVGLTYNSHADINLISASGAIPGITQIDFGWDKTRADKIVSARNGGLIQQDARLQSIRVHYTDDTNIDQTYVSYKLDYFPNEQRVAGADLLGKSLLQKVTVEVPTDIYCREYDEKAQPVSTSCRADDNNQRVVEFDYFTEDHPFLAQGGANQGLARGAALGLDFSTLASLTGNSLASPSVLGTNVSSDAGGALYLGFNWEPLKQLSSGAKASYSSRSTSGKTTLVDLTGDGIADLVVDEGNRLLVCPGTRPPGTQGVMYPTTRDDCKVATFDDGSDGKFLEERASTLSFGGEFNPWSYLVIGGAYSTSDITRSTYFGDVDGNGLIDFVKDGVPYFNQGNLVFSRSTNFLHLPRSQTEAPLASAAIGQFYDGVRQRASANQAQYPAADIVNSWRAPHSGVVALSGAFFKVYDGPKQTTNTRIFVDKSYSVNGGSDRVDRCFSSNVLAPGSNIVWDNQPVSTCLTGLSLGDVARIRDIATKAKLSGALFVYVNQGDTIYFRENGGTQAQFRPGSADIAITYVMLPGDVRRLEYVTQVLANMNGWDQALLAACVPARNGVLSVNASAPGCDPAGRSPYAFNLSSDLILSAIPLDDAGFSVTGEISFSGKLKFPALTQPIELSLLSTQRPKSAKSNALGREFQRETLEPSFVLADQNLWASDIRVVLPGNCGTNSVPPIQGVSLQCEYDDLGKPLNVVASFDKVSFDPCGSACQQAPAGTLETVLRLEVGPVTGESTQNVDASIVASLAGAGRAIDYSTIQWSEPPRLDFYSDENPSADLNGVSVDAGSLAKMKAAVPQRKYLTAIARGRYLRRQGAVFVGKFGPADRQDYYQRIEVDKERKYLSSSEAKIGKKVFDDPAVGERGYRLPGNATDCDANPDKLCEYRIAQDFLSDWPAFVEGSPHAFEFSLQLFVNGVEQQLMDKGIVPVGTCGVGPIEFGFPGDQINRPTDCGLADPSKIVPPQQGVKPQIGIHFALTDGNRVEGREEVYSFRARPGDVMHITATVRPVWNPLLSTPAFGSRSRTRPWDRPVLGRCDRPDHVFDRQIADLLYSTVGRNRCRPWQELRSSEVRLGYEKGLGLSGLYRFDVARLFVDINFAEEHEKYIAQLVYPRVPTDSRGWGRFVLKDNQPGTAVELPSPPYRNVQYPPQTAPAVPNEAAARSVGTECTQGSAGNCDGKATAAGKTANTTVNVFPMTATYWADDVERGPSTIGSPTSSTIAAARTCAPAGGPTPCFIGPDSDIWLAFGRTAQGTILGQYSGHIGPDDLVENSPSRSDLQSAQSANSVVTQAELGRGVADPTPFIAAPALLSNSTSWSARAGPGSIVESRSTNHSLYIDMNGDGYPDPIIGGTVYPTGPTGIGRTQWISTPNGAIGAQNRNSVAKQLGVQIGLPGTAAFSYTGNGTGYLAQSPAETSPVLGPSNDATHSPEKTSSDAPFGIGVALNLDIGAANSTTDLIDINGDGLPDKVQLPPPSQTCSSGATNLRVQFNLGYAFSPVHEWSLPITPCSQNTSGGLGLSLGYNDGSNGWSGGLALAHNGSSSKNALIDMNGDGRPDLVAPTDGGFNVYWNQGTGFTSNPTFIRADEWAFQDTAASESNTTDIGVTVAPAYACWLFCFIIVNPGVLASRVLSRNLVLLQDLNGDGLPDLSSTAGFYQGYSGGLPQVGFPEASGGRNYYNPLGRRNKLRTVTNSSGSKIHLDYTLVGNDGPQNPRGIWALSKIEVDDGFYPDAANEDGDDRLIQDVSYRRGIYDRYERKFLGFEELEVVESGCSLDTMGECTDGPTPLRRTLRSYYNDSIYLSGTLRRETVFSGADATKSKPYYLTEFGYDIFDLKNFSSPISADPVCIRSAVGTTVDESCFRKIDADRLRTVEALQADLWYATLPRRNMPRLRAIRKIITEGKSLEADADDAVRSMVLYEYDGFGNVVQLIDLGQVRNSTQTADDTKDDFRLDIEYVPIPTDLGQYLRYAATDTALLDRVFRLRSRKGVDPDFDQNLITRMREATYSEKTGHVRTICSYLKITVALDTSPEARFCAQIDQMQPPTSDSNPQTDLAAVVARVGLKAADVVVQRNLEYDRFGNLIHSVTPFNEKGDWIERRRLFSSDGPFRADPFVLTPVAIAEAHCTPESAGFVAASSSCSYGRSGTSFRTTVALTSKTAVDVRHGAPKLARDVNQNTLYYNEDNWGRVRTIATDWGKPNSTMTFVSAPAKQACNQIVGAGADCNVLAYVDYSSTEATGKVWGASVLKYVPEDLYSGGSLQDEKSVVWQTTFVDGIGKPLQQNKEGPACLKRGSRPDPSDPSTHHSSGAPNLCSSEALGTSSGWQAYDGLGRVVRQYFPTAIEVPAGTTDIDATIAQFQRHATTGASRSENTYDPLGRILQVVQPDQNQLQFAYRTSADLQIGLSRVRAISLDPRCAAKVLDRDARGLIHTVWEQQQAFFGGPNPSTVGHMTPTDRRDAERDICKRDDDQNPLDAVAALITQETAGTTTAQDTIAATRYAYDELRQLATISRPMGSDLIRVKYDLLGRRVEFSDSDRGAEILTYDSLGNVVERSLVSYRPIEPKKIAYLYSTNRLVGVRYEAGYEHLNVDYVYDDYPAAGWLNFTGQRGLSGWLDQQAKEACHNCLGRLVATKDASGVTVQSYDVLGSITESLRSIWFEGKEKGRFIETNEHDVWGTLRSSRIVDVMPEDTHPNCISRERARDYLCGHRHSIYYEYDQSGKMFGVRFDSIAIAQFSYDEFEATFAKWTADGSITDYTFDVRDRRLNHLETRLWNGRSIQDVQYAYDPSSNITRYDNQSGDPTRGGYLASFRFDFDPANRITAVHDGIVQDATNPPINFSEKYSYDLRHRLTSKGARQYQYADFAFASDWKPVDAPQTIKAGDKTLFNKYDGWGNLESAIIRVGRNATERRELEWDPEARLTVIRIETGQQSVLNRYDYDHTKTRVIKQEGVTPKFRDGTLQLYVTPNYTRRWDSPGHVHISANGQRLATIALTRTPQIGWQSAYFYQSDVPNGSVTSVTEQTAPGSNQGKLYHRLEYGPYGELLYKSDQTAAPQGAPYYAYAGKELDTDTGYVFFGARYYDPHSASWLSPDPVISSAFRDPRDTANYLFTRGNPISYVDPDGRAPQLSWNAERTQGVLTAAQGGCEATIGVLACAATGWTGVGAVGGAVVALHGVDRLQAGLRQAWTGEGVDSFTSQGMQKVVSRKTANNIDDAISFFGSLSAGFGAATKGPSILKGASQIGREIELVDGFYETEGSAFKFSKYYYEKLWATGRGAPFVQAEEIFNTATSVTPDRMAGFYRYTNEFMEMVYNPTTKEVWHMMPR